MKKRSLSEQDELLDKLVFIKTIKGDTYPGYKLALLEFFETNKRFTVDYEYALAVAFSTKLAEQAGLISKQ
jgi:hypothetical protein